MKASTLHRAAAVCLLFFAIAHIVGFQQSDPTWGLDALRTSMRPIHPDRVLDRDYPVSGSGSLAFRLRAGQLGRLR